jgi:hypothetical protein
MAISLGISPNPAPCISINRSKSGENPSVPNRILHERALPLTITRWSWSLTSAAITGFARALAIMRIAVSLHSPLAKAETL